MNTSRIDEQKILKCNSSYIERLNESYQAIDPSFKGIEHRQKPILKNLSASKIIYSLHGFLGTPEEMSHFDQDLIKYEFAIYHDIIPGFSANAKIANSFKWSSWVAEIEEKLIF